MKLDEVAPRLFRSFARLRSSAALLAAITAFASFTPACDTDVEVDCSKGEPCDDSFALSVIPGGAGFEVGTYHFAITGYDVSFTADCFVTGSAEQTTCEPLQPADATVEIPSFHAIKDEDGVITSFDIAYASAPPSIQVRIEFGDEQLTDTTYTEADYEEVRLAKICPVLCVQAEEELTVLP
jgi:hypothetical protein